jgi:membrane protease YdiL (CAAX protease family)
MDGRARLSKQVRLSRLLSLLFVVCALAAALLLWVTAKGYSGAPSTTKPPYLDVASQLLGASAAGAAGSLLALIIIQLEIWSNWLKLGRHAGETRPELGLLLIVIIVSIISAIAWPLSGFYFYFEASPVAQLPK